MTDSARRIRWGILGTGGIAASFARDLQLLDDAEVVAVGSRSDESASGFAGRFDLPRAYGSYEKLVDDPDIDVVYVATPQTAHAANVRLALEAGKPVLCEKPFTVTGAEAREVVDLARDRGVFLMEAMWTRFLPHFRRIDQLLRSGVLGEITTVVADHGQAIPAGGGHRLHDPALAGGALLDLGVYPVSLASYVLGRPAGVVAAGTLLPNGLDAQTSAVFTYEGGAHAVVTTTLGARTANRAVISGTQARLEIDDVWYAPTSFSLLRPGSSQPERFEHTRVGGGLRHQAAEVGRLLREGATESDVMPLDETVAIMETLDEIRRQIGLRFPGE
ncbi:Gfo/Idh/MocA family protein [Jiangella rhizosphaerae]|uniref:Gfo/Idh/MocA family oxidoreductase n=1 Tax=Jiangella rhizosphaerae TaxID=2293569 RepID=A0A418KX14_9ACTN|nr:Gfo/Idh/MocA family oxidoreductase [Jiangella rhizosphaerae]RIQ35914.1 gfo/Idh/MocA family oxidoreductase [Jiangella rhizosphaerae]